jgi:hypothetical protein
MKDVYEILLVSLIIFLVVGVFELSKADTLDRVRDKEKNDTSVFVYVFNDKTELWDKAREDTLKNATCEKLHMYVINAK